MKSEREKTVAFTGHRRFETEGEGSDLFSGAKEQTPEAIAERIVETATKLIEDGYTDFLCGMAEGFDLLAGETILRLRREYPHIRLISVRPFPEQHLRFSIDNRQRFEEVLEMASEVITICLNYSIDCFHRRNDYLVENSSLIISYYNGSKGGTAYTVNRALKNGLRIINLA